MNNRLKNHRLHTVLIAGIAGSLLLGGCASNEEAQQNANSGFTGVTSAPAEQEASKYPFPSNGLKDDGYGVYQQSTISDDDPLFQIAKDSQQKRNFRDPEAVRASFTDEEVSEAEAFVFKFVSEEGIDSTLRAFGPSIPLEEWENWVVQTRHLFVDDIKFVPKQTENMQGEHVVSPEKIVIDGLPNGNPNAPYNWKASSFGYKYGEEIMRMASRNIEPGEIFAPGPPGHLGFKGTVQYSLLGELNGMDIVESDTASYHIVVTKNDAGEWKIYSVSMYGSLD